MREVVQQEVRHTLNAHASPSPPSSSNRSLDDIAASLGFEDRQKAKEEGNAREKEIQQLKHQLKEAESRAKAAEQERNILRGRLRN